MGLRETLKGFLDNLSQPWQIGQRQIDIFHQALQLGWHADGWRGKYQRAPIRGKFLAYVPQTPHHDWALHMPMKILQDEYGFERHCFHRGQRLHRVKSVIDGSLA
ncbi:MAG: hypothetical protein AUG75_20365 [Cyanobacteria bacterium 13_1_20CM_4_61_6]|nr:MAG: hypothetical protein AUG75_20365 [Cyanobacteria bacterium 13_1_20CM_4_61_6]